MALTRLIFAALGIVAVVAVTLRTVGVRDQVLAGAAGVARAVFYRVVVR